MRRLAALVVGISSSCVIAACAASGSEDQTHGPVFDLDAGPLAAIDARAAGDGNGPARDAGATADASIADGALAEGASLADASGTSDANAPVDADAAIPIDAAGCTSVTGVLGGSGTTLFGASSIGVGALTAQTLSGSAASAPALLAFGGSLRALVRATGNAVVATQLASTWAAPAALGGNAAAIDAPAVAPVGAALHGVYLFTNNRYFHATYASAWDTGADPVGPVGDGGVQAFGPARVSAAGLATELVITYLGSDGHLYAQSWTKAAGWGTGVKIGTTLVYTNTPPAVVALDAGANDLLVVYVNHDAGTDDTKLFASTRDATSKAWSAPAAVNATAFTHDAPALAPMSNGRAMLAWRGTDGFPYVSAYTPAASPAWSAPSALVAGTSPAVSNAPSLARGVCGDDAVAAYVSGGAVQTTRFVGGAWTTPAAIVGVSGAAVATIATMP